MSTLYAGLDIGTTGSKITLFQDAERINQFSARYPSTHDNQRHTIDPETVLSCVLDLLRKSIEMYPALEAVGISAFGETFVLLDETDTPLCESLLYTDSRGQKEAKWLEERLGKDVLGQITGQIGQGMFTLPKLLSLKEEGKLPFDRVRRICLMQDYIIYRLCGTAGIDYSSASRTLAFDIRKKEWSETILNACGISAGLFSKPYPVGSEIGTLLERWSTAWKARKPVRIIAIAHDQIANALGAGILRSGYGADGNGTCECVSAVFSPPVRSSILYDRGFGIVPFVDESTYASYALISTGGSLIDWVIRTYFSKEKAYCKDLFSYIHRRLKNEPSTVMILPHFAGASTPYMDAHAMGAIVNLTLSTTKFDIYQACLESLCYEMRISLQQLRRAGIRLKALIATGGGSVNEVFLQKKADILGLKIYQAEEADSGTLGSAILVGMNLRVFSSLEDGVKRMVRYRRVFLPDAQRHRQYMEQFRKYKKLYGRLKEVR